MGYKMISEWSTLGIEPTTDVREIKRAYARKLKQYSPEDSPEEFQKIRESYEYLMENLKFINVERGFINPHLENPFSQADEIQVFEPEGIQVDEVEKPILEDQSWLVEEIIKNLNEDKSLREKYDFLELNQRLDDEEEAVQFFSDFKERVKLLYAEYEKRLEYKNWIEVLKHDALLNFETRRDISSWFLKYISEGHFLPKEVMQLLNEYFAWEDEYEEFFEAYYIGFNNYIREQIGNNIVPGYEYINKKYNIDLDSFIENREYGYIHFLCSDWDVAYDRLMKAYEIFPEDVYLQCLIGALFSATRQKKEGLEYINSGMSTASNRNQMRLFISQLLYNVDEYKEALLYCRNISVTSKYYPEVLYLMTNILCIDKKYYICSELLRERIDNNIAVETAKDCLRILHNRLVDLHALEPDKVRLRYELFKIYPYLNQTPKENPYEFKKFILPLVIKKIGVYTLYLFLIVVFIILKPAGLIILYLIGKKLVSKLKGRVRWDELF